MKKYVLTLEYQGTNYVGFQIQKNGVSIQSKIEDSLEILLKEKKRITYAGRTDVGVHALAQIICFETQKNIEPKKFLKSLNALLPNDIAFYKIAETNINFHPRYDCKAREYVYYIWNSNYRSVKWKKNSYWLKKKINCETLLKINEDLNYLVGEHDFSAMCHDAKKYINPKRTIYWASITKDEKEWDYEEDFGLLKLEICANAFLHNMVRIIFGTLLEIHLSKNKKNFKEILENKDRKLAGVTLPALGLHFKKAYYELPRNAR